MIPDMTPQQIDSRGRTILSSFQRELLKELSFLAITYDVSLSQLGSLLNLVPNLPISDINLILGEVLSMAENNIPNGSNGEESHQ